MDKPSFDEATQQIANIFAPVKAAAEARGVATDLREAKKKAALEAYQATHPTITLTPDEVIAIVRYYLREQMTDATIDPEVEDPIWFDCDYDGNLLGVVVHLKPSTTEIPF